MNPAATAFSITMKVVTFALLVATALAAIGGKIPPLVWATPATAVLALPYLAGATLAAGVLWLLSKHIWMAVTCGAVLLLCWPALSKVSPMGSERNTYAGEKTFKLLTYNVLEGIDNEGENPGYSRTFSYILKSKADIAVIQECGSLKTATNLTRRQRDSLKHAYPYIIESPAERMMLLSRFPAKRGRKSEMPYAYTSYELKTDGRKLTIFNVHLASYRLDSKERQVVTDITGLRSTANSVNELKGSIFKKLSAAFRYRAGEAVALRNAVEATEGNVIVCGDFNDVPASWTYDHILGAGLTDAYCETSFGPTATYNDHFFFFHIDQIFYRGNIRALSVARGSLKSSDHYPLTANFAFMPMK